MNVMKLFDVRLECKTSGELGVEVECEGSNLPDEAILWKGEHDGSLQGDSREYVLRKPLSLLGVYKAIKELDTLFVERDVQLDDSIRTGVHVHVNMQGSSKAQLFNLITLWAIFEDVLLDRCGAYRKGNLFCYPLSRSDNVFNIMMKGAKDNEYLSNFRSDQYRYCAVNVVSLHKYGSLEFRAMRTPRNVNDVYMWAKLLLQMKNFSAEFKNPIAMIECLNDIGAEAFYDDVFEGMEDYLTHKPDLDKQINEGLMIASAIAYSSDWGKQSMWSKVTEVVGNAKPQRIRPIFDDVVDGELDLDALGAFVEAINEPEPIAYNPLGFLEPAFEVVDDEPDDEPDDEE